MAERVRNRFGSLESLLTNGFVRWPALFILFSFVAIVQTWPLVLHISSSIADFKNYPFDTYAFIWSLWWVKHAIIELQTNPYQTDLLFFPQGTDLYLHTMPVVNGVLSIPLQVATGNLFLSWNVLALLFFVFSALAMYALSYRVNGSHMGALVSAYIFAFSPYILMKFTSHWHISTIWPIPLFALFLIRFQGSFRLKEAAAAGFFWALLTYNNLEFAMDAGVFLGLFAAYWAVVYLRQGERRERLLALGRGLAVVAAVWFIVASPLLIPTLLAVQSGDYFMPSDDECHSANALSFFTPSSYWGPGTEAPGGFFCSVLRAGGTLEGTLYLGGVPLLLGALSVFALRRAGRKVIFWMLVFLFFMILALGPALYIGGDKVFSVFGLNFWVPLPYQIYDHIPIIGERRAPARMVVFGTLGLSVLAGIGFQFLMSWLRQHYRKLAPLAAIIIMSLVVLEYWNPPVHLSELPTPAVLERISDEPGDFTVLHAPFGRATGAGVNGSFFGGPLASYYQTTHQKATFGGFVSRAKGDAFDWVLTQPVVRHFACATCEGIPSEGELNPAFAQAVFRKFRIKYVVVHRLDAHGRQHVFETDESLLTMEAYLGTVLGMTPIYQDPFFTVYRNGQIENEQVIRPMQQTAQ